MQAKRQRFRIEGNGGSRFAGDERGSLTIFSLFMFLLLLMMAGMAVDMIRHEHDRVAMQNTLDSAVLAASSLSQSMDPEVVVKEYVSKAGLDPNIVKVTSNGNAAGITTTERSVTVTTDVSINTMFMDLMGVNRLTGPVDAAATEGDGVLEIVLVLDISGSMNRTSADPNQTKIQALRIAAKKFLDTVFQGTNPANLAITIVPYNDQVRLDADFYSRLSVENLTKKITLPSLLPGSLTSYRTLHPDARCLLFNDADFLTTKLSASAKLTPGTQYSDDYFSYTLNGGPRYDVTYAQPNPETFRCGPFYSPVLPLSNNQTALSNHIDGLQISGNTAIHYGMKYAVSMLDPSMAPTVTSMILSGRIAPDMAGLPLQYNRADSKKIVVLMTDGKNTTQRDMKPEFRSGPTRVWYSPSASSEYQGFYVRMPNNPTDRRWYKPGDPNTTSDDKFVAETALPVDAVQWDYHKMYSRFGYRHAAMYFFKNSGDSAAYNAHLDAAIVVSEDVQSDRQLKSICDTAKAAGGIEIYTIAFEAPVEGRAALQDCASSPSHYFDVDGTDISTAFDSIATQVTVLQLVR